MIPLFNLMFRLHNEPFTAWPLYVLHNKEGL